MDGFLSCRRRVAERMDEPNADPEELRRSLAFLRVVNRWLGYTRSTLHFLEQFSQNWSPGQRITLLDLGTGSADVPRAILRWGSARGFDLRTVGIDLHPVTAQAAGAGKDAHLQIVQADVMSLPFAPDSFDYALSSMFLHHLSEEQVVTVLAAMTRVARRGVIVADLLRDPRAYRWIKLFSLFSTPMVRHDGPASVAQAFSRSEIIQLRDQAEMTFARYHQQVGYRFVLAGEK